MPGIGQYIPKQKVPGTTGGRTPGRAIKLRTAAGTVLIPTVGAGGRVMSDDEAVAVFNATGRHLGVFDSDFDAAMSEQQVQMSTLGGGR